MLLALLSTAPASATCTTIVDDDLTDGATDGEDAGGSFTGSGWVPDGGTMVYNFPWAVDRGSFTLTLAGLEESGLSQNDVAEMFTAHDGSFSDGESHSFLQLKMAGDVYDGYAGRIKMHIGGEYGDMELAEWSDERDWDPTETHTITVNWGDGWVEMEHDGVLVAGVDYTAYNSGFVPFETLRIPNDGWYAYDPVMSDLRYTHVTLCGEAEVTPGAPTIHSFDVQPRELAQGEVLGFTWDVGGSVDTMQICGQSRSSGELLCGEVTGASSNTAVGSEILSVGTWDIWFEAQGGGGIDSTGTIPVTVHEVGWVPGSGGGDTGGSVDSGGGISPEDSGSTGDDENPAEPADGGKAGGLPGEAEVMDDEGCGCVHGSAAGGAWSLALLGVLFRRRR